MKLEVIDLLIYRIRVVMMPLNGLMLKVKLKLTRIYAQKQVDLRNGYFVCFFEKLKRIKNS